MRRGLLVDRPAEPGDLHPGFLHVLADAAAYLDLRLEELGLDLVAQHPAAAVEQLLHVGGQPPALRIDDLVLFLDADRQLWQAHDGLLCKRGSSLAVTTE
jgi:hypothetical protein